VTTVELDSLAAETAASFTTLHPDYALLVGDPHLPTIMMWSFSSSQVAP
jgi:hypothetical protein